jgi:hypothetical protein
MTEDLKQTEYYFDIIENVSPIVWDTIKKAEDCNMFFTQGWDSYLKELGKKRIVISVSNEGKVVGYFVGSRFWAGIKMIMAPSMGTGTYTQGLCMLSHITEIDRIGIYKQLVAWLFEKKQADYVQVCDLQIREESMEWKQEWHHALLDKEGVHYTPRYTYLVDIQKTEEEMWANCHQNIRRYVNRGKKEGLEIRIVEKEEDIEPFIDQHYEHIQDMLRRKKTSGLTCQRRKNLSLLCHALFPNHALMFQVIGKDEKGKELSLSSCIFAYGKTGSTFYTGASYHEYMNRHPNELMMWEAMRLLHERNAGAINLGGIADYKKKLGPICAMIPVMTFSKYSFLHNFYTISKKCYGKMLVLLGHLK